MNKSDQYFSLPVGKTEALCPIGEVVGNRNLAQGRVPVLSCEGACIRGEIARLAANLVAKEEPYSRACHGELFSVPDSAMSQWVRTSAKVVLIDGCFLRCHGRILENLIGKEKLLQFDALSVYKKYTDVFDIDDVPEVQRKEAATQVAAAVLAKLKEASVGGAATPKEAASGTQPQELGPCS